MLYMRQQAAAAATVSDYHPQLATIAANNVMHTAAIHEAFYMNYATQKPPATRAIVRAVISSVQNPCGCTSLPVHEPVCCRTAARQDSLDMRVVTQKLPNNTQKLVLRREQRCACIPHGFLSLSRSALPVSAGSTLPRSHSITAAASTSFKLAASCSNHHTTMHTAARQQPTT
jgi:hypothetical protein